MRFSVCLFQTQPLPDWLDAVEVAEAEGFDRVWVGDSPMIWREAYVTMAAALLRTSTIEVGLAVTNPVTRDVSVTASAFATLAELSGGRAVLAMGLGDSAVETIGRRPARIAELQQSVVELRNLLAGDRADPERETRLQWVQDGTNVPVFIGGSGPRMLDLMGTHGDGAILMAGAQVDLLRLAHERVERAAGGRAPYSVAWVPASVLDDAQVARDNVRGHVARCATHALAWEFSDSDQQLIERLRESYDYYGHLFPASPQASLVPDRLVDMFAVAGAPADARQRVLELVAAPVEEIAFVVHGHDVESQLRYLARDVLSGVANIPTLEEGATTP